MSMRLLVPVKIGTGKETAAGKKPGALKPAKARKAKTVGKRRNYV